MTIIARTNLATYEPRQTGDCEWTIEPFGKMRVPAILYASPELIEGMGEKVYEQITNVATLPGIVRAAYALPDAHWGYGFPIGGVAAFNPDEAGIVSGGGVGFDISCGVRTLLTGLSAAQIRADRDHIADALFAKVPAGLGSRGSIHLGPTEMDDMLTRGALWALDRGYARPEDLERIEDGGCAEGARPDFVSEKAKHRQRDEIGTLGSGNHYLEVQEVDRIFDEDVASTLGLYKGEAVITFHCGSRGLGHQIGTEFLRDMWIEDQEIGLDLPDRELACAPINSEIGQRYLGAMRAGINCALANRTAITGLVREVFSGLFPQADLKLVYDVSHNTCKEEVHEIDGQPKKLFVHRKGATRAFGPGHPSLPESLESIGQPVIIGGSMGTSSYILVGTEESEGKAFSSACHGAGRAMSRHAATRRWRGRAVIDQLDDQGISIRSPSLRGVAEEAPDAYKNIDQVILAAETCGLSRPVAKLVPIVCIKG